MWFGPKMASEGKPKKNKWSLLTRSADMHSVNTDTTVLVKLEI